MWVYEKKLQYPINIKNKDLKMANAIFTQFGGPNGELAAALRYLSQRINMPTSKAKGLLNDIGTEELAHVEMIQALIYQLSRGATPQEYKDAGLQGYYGIWDSAIFPSSPLGEPFTTSYINNVGDPIANIYENLAAEEKARSTYEQLIQLTNDPDVIKPLSFLRQREIIHFQRFGELLDDLQLQKQMKTKFVVKKNNC